MKKTLLALFIASSIGVVSLPAVANIDARTTYTPDQAVDMVCSKIKAAIDAINSGSDGETVANLIKDALDASKEVNANDRVDRERYKANNKLKSARTHAKSSALQEAEQELKNAYQGFQDLKKLF
ncbi:hypothetical protein [Methylocucumis oryzae]|uniref:Uncharacterized protein n=1 Tax=Methylocucumis oryzae TaxID=1632867 RepID=A0A0F3IEX0_9GAMM|nr:hypothetical protein [Methylocucumis oryzae]KJV05222.1 hypothetical protein VZ94_19770 [Methylocucumis oryzae]